MAQNLSELIWSVAELLRGDYKQSDYGQVILPFTLLRRLDCVLEGTKQAVLKEAAAKKDSGEAALDRFLLRASGESFYNTSRFDFSNLLGDPQHLKANLLSYVRGFSASARDVFDRYKFADQIENLDAKNLLFLVTQKFAAFDLHPKEVDNTEMGLVFEELIRRFGILLVHAFQRQTREPPRRGLREPKLQRDTRRQPCPQSHSDPGSPAHPHPLKPPQILLE